MTLDLTKRSETGSANLTVVEHDANLTAIESEVNNKIAEGDPRLTDARTPLAHTHVIANVTGLQTALDGKATTSQLATVDAKADAKVNATDLAAAGGAAVVGIADAAGRIAATHVEGALAEHALALEGKADAAGAIELVTSNTDAITAPLMIPVFGDAIVPLIDGVPVFLSNGRFDVLTPALYGEKLYPGGLVAKIDSLQAQIDALAVGGGAPPAPDNALDWDLLDPATDGDLNLKLLRAVPSGVTGFDWEPNGSGTWTTIASTTVGDHMVAGFTNGVSQSVKIRFRNASGPGAASTPKTRTPTAPTFTPTLVTNGSGISIQYPSNAHTDSKFATLIAHVRANTAALSGLQNIYDTASSNPRVKMAFNYTTNDIYVQFQNSSATVIGALSFAMTLDTVHTVAVSVNFTGTPAIDVRMDGVALANTGDIATGYKVNTAFVADATIDWAVGSGTTYSRIVPAGNYSIGGIYVDNTRARATSLFRSASGGLTDWNAVADGAEPVCLFNRTLAQWNAADAVNPGYATLTNNGTFT